MKFSANNGLTDLDIKTLDLVQEADGELVANITGIAPHSISIEKPVFLPNGFGKWFFFQGHLLPSAIIQADHLGDAYDIYIDECITLDEQPEGEQDAELGHYTGSGKWISEVEQSYIHGQEGIPPTWDFEFEFTIK